MGEMMITKVPVGAIALMVAAISAVLGLIAGILTAIGLEALASILPTWFPISVGYGALGAIIGGVVGGFIGGYIITAIIALLYNWLAPKVGGVKLELE
jgi:hypothetical protein